MSAEQRVTLGAVPGKKSRILARSSSPEGNEGGKVARHSGKDLKILQPCIPAKRSTPVGTLVIFS